MDFLAVGMALFPILLVLFLLLKCNTAADTAGIIGWAVAGLVAWFFFRTSPGVIFEASLAGVIASLPIALVVATSILQVTVMLETGAIARVVSLIKSVAPTNRVAQMMIINVGFGTLLTALGAVPISILPPIMMALGYSSFVAIALPAIGYDALCTYALLGVPAVVFSSFTSNFLGTPVGLTEANYHFAMFMPVVSTCVAIAMIWIVGKWKLVFEGLVPTLIAGLTGGVCVILVNMAGMVTLTGIIAGLAVIVSMLLYLKATKQPVCDRSTLNENDLAAERKLSLSAAISPWIILTGTSFLLNAPFLPFFDLTFNKFVMPLEIIPGAPSKLRVLWQPYLWVLISTFAALPFLKISSGQMKTSMSKWFKRAPRPTFAAAVFFAMAYVINHSGKGPDWQLAQGASNMIQVLAGAASNAFGSMYPVIAPYLGLLGGFISGSETSSIAMLTDLHLSTAQTIGVSGLIIAAASAIGGGLASVISPAKLQNASASIDRIGEEGSVMRTTFVITIIITGVVSLATLIWTMI